MTVPCFSFLFVDMSAILKLALLRLFIVSMQCNRSFWVLKEIASQLLPLWNLLCMRLFVNGICRTLAILFNCSSLLSPGIVAVKKSLLKSVFIDISLKELLLPRILLYFGGWLSFLSYVCVVFLWICILVCISFSSLWLLFFSWIRVNIKI